jgi:hypothetical protein
MPTDVNHATTAAISSVGCDLIVALTVGTAASGSAVMTDSVGTNTWSDLTGQSVSGQAKAQLHYTANPATSASHTFTATLTGASTSLMVMGFSGSKLSSPFDQQNGANATSMPLSTGSITPGQDGELIVSAIYNGRTGGFASSTDTGVAFTQISQLSQVGGVSYGSMMAYGVQGTAAAASASWDSSGGSSNIAAVIASFKPAAALPNAILEPNDMAGGLI